MTRLVALHAARALCSETAYSEKAKPDDIVTKEREKESIEEKKQSITEYTKREEREQGVTAR